MRWPDELVIKMIRRAEFLYSYQEIIHASERLYEKEKCADLCRTDNNNSCCKIAC